MARNKAWTCIAAVVLLVAAQQAGAADPLPALTIDPARTTVSGLSSGAYMAGQFHVAFSAQVSGAGLVAGGPYGCAEGRLEVALQRCMATNLGEPDPEALLAKARASAAAGAIDPLANVADDRVYVFTGTADRTVLPSVGATIPAFYVGAGLPPAAVHLDASLAAGHGFATEDGPVGCAATGPPFVNDCDYDQARGILEHLRGPLQPPAAAVGVPLGFDQTLYLASPEARGMAAEGWVYVPAPCAAGTRCGVHVVFHGCKQNHDLVGDAVTVGAGYNRWAESNGVVVLYPQTHATPTNPNACWDWWGYTGAGYATRQGVQMAAVHRMLRALAGEPGNGGESCARHEDWNLTHWQQGRAVPCGWGVCAAGSGDPLGTYFSASTVFESPAGFYTAEPCAG